MKTPAPDLTLAAIAAALERECPGIATHDECTGTISMSLGEHSTTFSQDSDTGRVFAWWGPVPQWDDAIFTIADAVQHARWFVNTYTDYDAPVTPEEEARGEAVMAKWRELAEQGRLERQRGQGAQG